jgi:SAM-dependent methyltransferase
MRPLNEVMNHPMAYRLWQRPFADSKLAPFWRHTSDLTNIRVLDVGCGPGTNARHFSQCSYLGIDKSLEYIDAARRMYGDRFAVVDVVNDEIPGDVSFDLVFVNSLLHHIDTPGVEHILRVLHRRLAIDGTIHIFDCVQPEHPGLPRLLARWDRGDFFRPLRQWRDLFEAVFEPIVFEPYSLPAHGITLWNMIYFKGKTPVTNSPMSSRSVTGRSV